MIGCGDIAIDTGPPKIVGGLSEMPTKPARDESDMVQIEEIIKNKEV